MRLNEFIEVMENYTYFSMEKKFTYKEMRFFVRLLSDYAEYLSQYDDSASMRSIVSSCRLFVKTLTEDFVITHIESLYSGLRSEYQEISRSNNIQSFYDFVIPYLRDIKLGQLIN